MDRAITHAQVRAPERDTRRGLVTFVEYRLETDIHLLRGSVMELSRLTGGAVVDVLCRVEAGGSFSWSAGLVVGGQTL